MRAVDVTGYVDLELEAEPLGRLEADGSRASLEVKGLRVLRTAIRAMGKRRQRRARLELLAGALSSGDVTFEVRIRETIVAVGGASGRVNWTGRILGTPLEVRPLALARVALASVRRNGSSGRSGPAARRPRGGPARSP